MFLGFTIHFNADGMHVDVDAIHLDLDEKILKALMTPTWVARQYAWPVNVRMHYQVVEDSLVLRNPAVSVALATLGGLVLGTYHCCSCILVKVGL